ncbi:MAG TPA: SufE family protein [Bacteroidales bacterium]|nr:SufE family protein [Bacteroidales bacterium]
MTLQETQDAIVEEFLQFDDWLDRYNYLIEISKELQPLDNKYKANEYLIKGCQSRVWLSGELIDGKVVFTADSDAIITKGIIALLIRVLSNREPDEIISAELEFIDKIGLKENLSPTRANGLVSMIKQMRMFALAYKTKMEQNK